MDELAFPDTERVTREVMQTRPKTCWQDNHKLMKKVDGIWQRCVLVQSSHQAALPAFQTTFKSNHQFKNWWFDLSFSSFNEVLYKKPTWPPHRPVDLGMWCGIIQATRPTGNSEKEKTKVGKQGVCSLYLFEIAKWNLNNDLANLISFSVMYRFIGLRHEITKICSINQKHCSNWTVTFAVLLLTQTLKLRTPIFLFETLKLSDDSNITSRNSRIKLGTPIFRLETLALS